MRRWNAILTGLILVLFLLHAILGGFQLLAVGDTALKTAAWICGALILLHTVFGVKLTADTLRVWKTTGVGYFRENRVFWLRRLSGLAVMVFLIVHLTAFHGAGTGGSYRLPWFSAGRLASQILLLLSLGVHILSNLRPAMLSFGIPGRKRWRIDFALVLTVLLLFFAAAMLVYYLRWNVW